MYITTALFYLTLLYNTVFCIGYDSEKIPYNMVYIPGDSYNILFKEVNDISKHEVSSFLIDKYPVTNKEFKEFIFNNDKWEPLNVISFFSNREYLNNWLLNDNFYLILKDPVVNVSWYACVAYCTSLDKRLPILDEWEYVSNATQNFPYGINDFEYIQKVLNWYINAIAKSEYIVKNMFYNYWNVFGLHGVIWEWVYDFNSIIIVGSEVEGGEQEQSLFCGAGAENSVNPVDYVGFMRYAFRNSLDSVFSLSSLGFRCVKPV